MSKDNPFLGPPDQTKRIKTKFKAPKGFWIDKPKLRNVILICRICGNAYKDKVDLRLSLGVCPSCLDSHYLDGSRKKETTLSKSKTNFWDDFVWYYVAHGTGAGWIDPDEREKDKNAKK